jgi:hypothetical protein
LRLLACYFNETGTYFAKTDRTPEDDLLMEHMAHASRLSWQQAGDANNWAVGEWQIYRCARGGNFYQTEGLQI